MTHAEIDGASQDGQGGELPYTGPDEHPGQYWINGALVAGAETEAEARAILDGVASAPLAGPSPSDVKREAERRILAILPEHKQRNTLATGLEATLTHGPDPANWPADLRTRHTDAMADWARIEALRARSNEIEAMRPIPADFANDTHWR